MCFVRGDPRTADYTVRFYAGRSVPEAANDNVQLVRRTRAVLRPGTAHAQARPKRHAIAPGLAATAAIAAVAISGSVWLTMSLVPLIVGVFG
jgi:hypothetical protein